MNKNKLFILLAILFFIGQAGCQKAKIETKIKDPADDLIEKMSKATNEEALKDTKSISMKMKMAVPLAGLSGISQVFSTENKSYIKVSIAGMENEMGYDGKTAWGKDITQGIRELSGQEKESIIQSTIKVLKDPKSYYTKIILSPDEIFQEKNCFVLTYKKDGISDKKSFIDKLTYLPVGSFEIQDTPQGKMNVKSIYNNYKKLENGYLMANSITQDMGIMKVNITFTEIKFNPVIDEKIFNQPEN